MKTLLLQKYRCHLENASDANSKHKIHKIIGNYPTKEAIKNINDVPASTFDEHIYFGS